MIAKTGSFKLVVLIGKSVVNAHEGLVPRSEARRLKAAYAVARPNCETRVVRV